MKVPNFAGLGVSRMNRRISNTEIPMSKAIIWCGNLALMPPKKHQERQSTIRRWLLNQRPSFQQHGRRQAETGPKQALKGVFNRFQQIQTVRQQ